MSKRYAISGADEARAYLAHFVLGSRLTECSQALLWHQRRSANEILGTPDDVKLRSSATLFASATPAGSVFEQLLLKYFGGERDARTVEILNEGAERG